MVIPHTDFPKVTWVIVIKVDPGMMQATSITLTYQMLLVLADATMSVAHMRPHIIVSSPFLFCLFLLILFFVHYLLFSFSKKSFLPSLLSNLPLSLLAPNLPPNPVFLSLVYPTKKLPSSRTLEWALVLGTKGGNKRRRSHIVWLGDQRAFCNSGAFKSTLCL